MERYYYGGFYLIKTKPFPYGTLEGKTVCTCSGCFNIKVFNDWCLSWRRHQFDEKEKEELGLTDELIKEIQLWTDSRFHLTADTLPDLKTAVEFKDLFFKSRNDFKIYSISFSDIDTNFLIAAFAEGTKEGNFNPYDGNFELRNNLIKKTEEKVDKNEEVLGYDFIGVEGHGGFHSFHCHNITELLIEKFSLKLNKYGLFDKPVDSGAY